MSNLRRAAISNSNLKSMDSSPSSGSASPKSMEKTDSVINLTKPALYSIYNDASLLSLTKDDEDNEEYIDVKVKQQAMEQVMNSLQANNETGNGNKIHARNSSLVKTVLKALVLSVSAYLYNEATKYIHHNHIPTNRLSYEPLYITNLFLGNFIQRLKFLTYVSLGNSQDSRSNYLIKLADIFIALTLQGLIMGSILPIMDYVLPSHFSRRLLSSNPNPNQSRSYSTLLNDLIRSLITFLGISYAIRKIEWNSFLQVSIIWSLLNPGLWLLLDGTISGFLSSLFIAMLACLGVYVQNLEFVEQYSIFNHDDFIAIWLWIGSFFFCGLIIFGKLGRVLF